MNWKHLNLPSETSAILSAAPRVTVAPDLESLRNLAIRDAGPDGYHRVSYDLPDGRVSVEAEVTAVRNGISANYLEPYMRRRDPDCMLIGDDLPSNKPRFHERYGKPFDGVRAETFEWLKTQELAVFPFVAGVEGQSVQAVAVAPANAGFFAFGLALLQGILSEEEIPEDFSPRTIIYTAPPFRQTHFEGKQVVVHNRTPGLHELFSYNLYPGPSAKKGIYGVLLALGEPEGWITAHCSTVKVITPYDNEVVFIHEGASGGGKSEMLEPAHRESDGRLLLGENVVTGEKLHVVLPRACELRPVTDDMAICSPVLRNGNGKKHKLELVDAEEAWFIRVNHIDRYGVDPHIEAMCVQPSEPLLFLNIDAAPRSTALIWEHIEDAPGEPCPNPRVVIPRRAVPGIIDGSVTVDIRSFGVRTPPCTEKDPSYGIIGLFHVLPPALAWLWRLVAPRGYANPSIVDSGGLSSEGVGSYWPFATGRRVDQANLLLQQIMATSDSMFVLTPNQHIGAWKTSFMPQWLMREYLARRGSRAFGKEALMPARCPLLGHALKAVQIEGLPIPEWFLRVDTQAEVGEKGYDAGADVLTRFFHEQISQFLVDDLLPQGRRLIEACLEGAGVDDYVALSRETEAEASLPLMNV